MDKPDRGKTATRRQVTPPATDEVSNSEYVFDPLLDAEALRQRVGRDAAVLLWDKPSRDKAIDRVGRALYDALWIELRKEEYELGKSNSAGHHPTIAIALPPSGKEAATIVRARCRWRMANEQTGQVIRWLTDLGIFDRPTSEFDAWFCKEFPGLSSTQDRKDASRDLLSLGLRPGDNITWNDFCDRVRERSGWLCDNRTIQRDVEELRSSGL